MPAAVRRVTRKRAEAQLSLDTHLLDVYLTGLQAEVEAKVRRVARFREQMRKIDAAGGATDTAARRKAAVTLLSQIDEMLATNILVRGTLEELRTVTEQVIADVEQLADD